MILMFYHNTHLDIAQAEWVGLAIVDIDKGEALVGDAKLNGLERKGRISKH